MTISCDNHKDFMQCIKDLVVMGLQFEANRYTLDIKLTGGD